MRDRPACADKRVIPGQIVQSHADSSSNQTPARDGPSVLPEADDGYQAGKAAWSPDRDGIEDLLLRARHMDMRSIYYGSNACYLVVLEAPGEGRSLAVYKPARGEHPLWDFPPGSLHRREVATYRLDALLGWGIIPPAVIGSGRFGPGSVQLFIEEAERGEVPVSALRRMALLDWITNNADRKPDHLIVAVDGRLWGIDHGLTFHAQPKLRTVLWHFAGEPLAPEETADLERLMAALEGADGRSVTELIAPNETAALKRRIHLLIEGRVFPDPPRKQVPYYW